MLNRKGLVYVAVLAMLIVTLWAGFSGAGTVDAAEGPCLDQKDIVCGAKCTRQGETRWCKAGAAAATTACVESVHGCASATNSACCR